MGEVQAMAAARAHSKSLGGEDLLQHAWAALHRRSPPPQAGGEAVRPEMKEDPDDEGPIDGRTQVHGSYSYEK